MPKLESKLLCLQDVYVHEIVNPRHGSPYVETYVAFIEGNTYPAEVNEYEDGCFVESINERGTAHVIKQMYDSDRFYKKHFGIIESR